MNADEEALLAGILASPDDDIPRLVYCDWLEEHAGTERCPECKGDTRHRVTLPGKPERRMLNMVAGTCARCGGTGRVSDGRQERAEFIRLQIELARMEAEGAKLGTGRPVRRVLNRVKAPRCIVLEADLQTYTALYTRSMDLLNANWSAGATSDVNWAAWLRPFPMRPTPAMVTYEPVVYRRGFCEEIACPAADWLAHGDELLKRHPVKKVRLTTPPPTSSATHPVSRRVRVWLTDAPRRKPGIAAWINPLHQASATIEYQADVVGSLLGRTWKGVAFELPPERPYHVLGFRPLEQEMRQLIPGIDADALRTLNAVFDRLAREQEPADDARRED